MISAILIGRNDDYEGDFRRRALLSINVLAEQLNDNDEIIRETLLTKGGEVVNSRVRDFFSLPALAANPEETPT